MDVISPLPRRRLTGPSHAVLALARRADVRAAATEPRGPRFRSGHPRATKSRFSPAGQLRAIALSAASSSGGVQCPQRPGRDLESTGTDRVQPPSRGTARARARRRRRRRAGSVLATANAGTLWPEFLPDGDHFLYLADSAEPAASPPLHRLDHLFRPEAPLPARIECGLRPRAALLRAGSTVLAAPFDLGGCESRENPSSLAMTSCNNGITITRRISRYPRPAPLVFRSLSGPDTKLVWRDRAERHSQVITPSAAQHFEPTLSPDQKRIAVDVFEPRPSKPHTFGLAALTSDIWIMEERGRRRFATDIRSRQQNLQPVWSPDGTRLAFSSNRRGPLDLYLRRIDGAAGDELLYASAENKHALAWSPDGRWLVYGSYDPKTHGSISGCCRSTAAPTGPVAAR